MIQTTDTMDNALVQQKNEVFNLLNKDKVRDAGRLLYILAPLWEACGYGYKLRELQIIIAERLS